MEANNRLREALELAKSTFETLIQFHGDEHFVKCWATLARDEVIAALSAPSAPPRNCDRFADELDAQLAFLNEVWLISVDRETMLERDKYENWTDEMRTRYGRWLLAQATEQKGETDGSK